MTSPRMYFLSIVFAVISVLHLSGCSGKGNAGQRGKTHKNADSSSMQDSSSAQDSAAKAMLDRIPVEVVDVAAGEISNYLLLSSTIETENVVDVYPQVGGIIESILVEEGDWVQKDQALLHLEDDDIILNEKKTEVDYLQQKATFSRMEKMHSQALISDEDFENARFNLQQAEIARDKARLTRERTIIRSPITGIVTQRLVQPGNLVTLSSKLFTITDPKEMICRVWVPERELRQLREGQRAFITTEATKKNRYAGWIKRISPVVDPATGTCKVTLGIRDENRELRPGMFVRTEIITDTHENAVLAPKNALIFENDQPWVFVVNDTLALKKRVDIGFTNGSRFEAKSGLNPGDLVVVVGQNALKDSSAVRIVSLDSTLTAAIADSNAHTD